jgi:CRP-like cAMP-binding protein
MLLSPQLNSNLSLGCREKELPLLQFQRGDEISVSDSGIWQVYRGVVQLSRIQADGSEIISGWVTANGVLGNFVDNSVIYRAVALGDVYAKRYTSNDLVRHPLLARQFLAQFSDRLIKSQHLLAIVGVNRIEERLRQLLSMFKLEIGQQIEDGVRLQVRFTHQHLAEAAHTTRVTVTRTLGDFQNQDLIYFDSDRHIVIKAL